MIFCFVLHQGKMKKETIMQNVNYIKHLKGVFLQFSKDNRLNPTHISLYVALFQIWNNNRFLEEFYINREEVMSFSKIGSKSTYHKCIRELNHWNILFTIHHTIRLRVVKLRCSILRQVLDKLWYTAIPKS